MFSRIFSAVAALVLATGTIAFAQTAEQKAKAEGREAKSDTKAAGRSVKDALNPQKTDTDAVMGRIKELTAGQKVVIDVDNAVDKEFNLADKTVKVVMAKSLKVGDPVKVTEVDQSGVKTVRIVKHSMPGVKHGDKDPNGTKQ
jgi:seryl-tRNA synthetase